MFLPKTISRFFILSISGVTVVALAGCGSGSGSGGITSTRTASVSNGTVNLAASSDADGSVSSPRVGLVAYASGLDTDNGRVVAAAGIADGATVGEPVSEGTVTYNTTYNYHVIDNAENDGVFIRGERSTRLFDGRTTLTANFDTGRLTGSTSDLDVDGRINGQTVSGTAVVNYDLPASPFIFNSDRLTGTVTTDLNGDIGDTGVIATFDGSDEDTVVAGGLVGTAN